MENIFLKAQNDTILRELLLAIKKGFEFNDRIKLLEKETKEKDLVIDSYLNAGVAYSKFWHEEIAKTKELPLEVDKLSSKLKKNNRTRNHIIGGLATDLLAALIFKNF